VHSNWPPTPRVPYERLYIRSSAVPNQEAHATRLHVSSVVIPDLIVWINGILTLYNNAPGRAQEARFVRQAPRLDYQQIRRSD